MGGETRGSGGTTRRSLTSGKTKRNKTSGKMRRASGKMRKNRTSGETTTMDGDEEQEGRDHAEKGKRPKDGGHDPRTEGMIQRRRVRPNDGGEDSMKAEPPGSAVFFFFFLVTLY